MKFLTKILISTFSVAVTAWLLPGVEIEDNFWTTIVVALLISFLNAILKPILVVLTLPITLFTFGLFLLIINGIIIYIAGAIVEGFTVTSLFWAIIFSLIISFINSFMEKQLMDESK